VALDAVLRERGRLIMASRGQDAARKLLGAFKGTLTSDRWNGYNFYAGKRQLCWAHLKRDFQALSEAAGAMGKIGRGLSAQTKKILRMHGRVRDGTLKRKTFQRRMMPLTRSVETLLKRGADSGLPLSGRCRRIHNQRRHLWAFVQDERVEPTNNLAERVVRQGVLWRKGSLGTQSERGARYAERMLTTCATLRLQGRSIIQYLRDACSSHLKGIETPSLVTDC
jgi:transposase